MDARTSPETTEESEEEEAMYKMCTSRYASLEALAVSVGVWQ